MSTKSDVIIDADVGPLRQKLREAAQSMQQFGQQAGSGLGAAAGPLEALRGKFIAITAVLAGGAMFGKAISDTAKYAEESIKLGKAMGTSATDASGWIAALEDAGVSTDEFSKASKGLLKNINADEKALNEMGLATRDAAGNLRPMNDLMLDAIQLTNEHKDGTDRNIAAAQIFGKGVDGSSNLLKINTETLAENRALMAELGLEVGENAVANYKAYDNAMDQSALVVKAFKTAIGNALMPVLTKLGEWFVSIGPAAVTVVKGAIGGLTAVFWGLKNAVTIVWETVKAMVYSVAEPVRSLAAALYKVITGDFKGAQEELTGWPERIAAQWAKAKDAMVASSEEARDKIAAVFVEDTPAAPAPSGTRSATVRPELEKKVKVEREKADPTKMPEFELRLSEEKRLAAEKDALREYTRQQEVEFWQGLLANEELIGKDRVAIQRKISGLKIEIARKEGKDQQALEAEVARQEEQLALDGVEHRRAIAQSEFDAGNTTRQQYLQAELMFEQQLFVLKRDAMLKKIKLAADDPTISPAERQRLHGELLALERQYGVIRIDLIGKINQEAGGAQKNIFSGIESAFSTNLDAMLSGAQTWQQSLAGIFKQSGMVFVQELITKPLAAWIANNAKMLAQKLGFLAADKVATTAASDTTIATKGTETGVVVTANATQAATGAAKAMSGIPYVGPILAIAAMAAMFAAVIGMRNKSASGGYDIPSGVNPMTQLHEEEMVLPKHLSNTIRNIAGEDEGRGSSRVMAPNIELRGVSAGDFIIAHKREFAAAFKGMRRDFGV